MLFRCSALPAGGKCQGRRPRPNKDASGGQPPSRKRDDEKGWSENFPTEKFYGANSVRSIQNIACLPDRLIFCAAESADFLGALPRTPATSRLASEPPSRKRADKKLDQNFSTEKFYGANSVRSIQNIAYLHRTVYGSAA